MTVAELKHILNKYPDDMEIVVNTDNIENDFSGYILSPTCIQERCLKLSPLEVFNYEFGCMTTVYRYMNATETDGKQYILIDT